MTRRGGVGDRRCRGQGLSVLRRRSLSGNMEETIGLALLVRVLTMRARVMPARLGRVWSWVDRQAGSVGRRASSYSPG